MVNMKWLILVAVAVVIALTGFTRAAVYLQTQFAEKKASPVDAASRTSGAAPESQNLQESAGPEITIQQSVPVNPDDAFQPGQLPVLRIAGMQQNQAQAYYPTSSFGFAGKIDPALHCGISVELRMLWSKAGKRLLKVSVPVSEVNKGQFAITLAPPDGGWPQGPIRAHVKIDELPQVCHDLYFWTNPDEPATEIPKPIDEFSNYSHMVVTGPIATDPFVIDAGIPLAFCGRFDDPKDVASYADQHLQLRIRGLNIDGRAVIYGSGSVIVLRDNEFCWFENFTAIPSVGLVPGTYTVQFVTHRGAIVGERMLVIRQPK